MQDPRGGKVASMHFKVLFFFGVKVISLFFIFWVWSSFSLRLSLFFDVVFFFVNVRL